MQMPSYLGRKILAVAVLAVGAAVAAPAHAQFAGPTGDRGPINDNFGGNYKDAQQRAADKLARGLLLKHKADQETDAGKKTKLLEKAKKEFQGSIALHANHDAYLALGLIQIELGSPRSGAEACTQALGLQPQSQAAKDCIQTAQNSAKTDPPAAASNNGS
jgi:hypothetical protein